MRTASHPPRVYRPSRRVGCTTSPPAGHNTVHHRHAIANDFLRACGLPASSAPRSSGASRRSPHHPPHRNTIGGDVMRSTSAQRSALIGHPRIVGHRPPHSIHRRNAIVDDAVLACARRRADRLTRRPSAASRTSRASLQRHRPRRAARTGKTTPRSRSFTASRASRARRVLREASPPPPARHPPVLRGTSPPPASHPTALPPATIENSNMRVRTAMAGVAIIPGGTDLRGGVRRRHKGRHKGRPVHVREVARTRSSGARENAQEMKTTRRWECWKEDRTRKVTVGESSEQGLVVAGGWRVFGRDSGG
ncbi:hypothetical protein C8J57DRAFT_1342627 [Mycena rebaudengoi]|nr:hypothetical protein C8J57DRAFT_1342627 [Mycena rebaudengoi]